MPSIVATLLPLRGHIVRSSGRLFVLAAAVWLPGAVALALVLQVVGPDALRSGALAPLVLLHVALAVGYAFALPAMFAVLHQGADLHAAALHARSRLLVNLPLALPVGVLPPLVGRAMPELVGDTGEVLAVQALAAFPLIMVCQLAWIEQAADGRTFGGIAGDVAWLLRRFPAQLVGTLGLVHLVSWTLLMPMLVPVLTAPVTFLVLTPVTAVLAWGVWMSLTDQSPAWQYEVPTASAVTEANGTDVVQISTRQPAPHAPATHAQAAVAPPARVVSGSGCAKLVLAGGSAAQPAGAWICAEEDDSFTVTARIAHDDATAWAIYAWQPGGAWRELELVWNDGRHVVAYGVPRSESTFVAAGRRDGAPTGPVELWVSIATRALAHDRAESARQAA